MSAADASASSLLKSPATIKAVPVDSAAKLDRELQVGRGATLVLESDSLLVHDPSIRDGSEDDRLGQCCFPISSCSSTLSFTSPSSSSYVTEIIPYYNILWADVSHGYLVVDYAAETKTDVLSVAKIYFPVIPENKSATDEWISRLMDLAYGRAQRRKRIKALVNPFGGKGHAQKLYSQFVEPILLTARCSVDQQETEYCGHGIDIAENIDIDAYDVIAACSGDGVGCEIFNGLGKRPDASVALRKLAVTNIPCGSGNAMSWNLNGTGSPSVAALSVVKGLRMPMDLVSITQGDRRILSFLSQSFGIIAESDLATENIRWMGAARFTYGYIVRLLGKNTWPCDLALKVDIEDREAIREHYHSIISDLRRKSEAAETPLFSNSGMRESYSSLSAYQLEEDEMRGDAEQSAIGLPPLKYGRACDPLPEGWKIVPHEQMGNFYAGNMAYMAEDSNFFTTSLPNDGCLDLITVRGDVSRRVAVGMFFALAESRLFEIQDITFRKVSGYRLIPREKEGYISIDGERIPFEPFQAEVHKGLGTVLSKTGYRWEASGPQ